MMLPASLANNSGNHSIITMNTLTSLCLAAVLVAAVWAAGYDTVPHSSAADYGAVPKSGYSGTGLKVDTGYKSIPKISDYDSGSKPYSSGSKASDYGSGSKAYSSGSKASDYSSGSKAYSSGSKASDYSSGSKAYSSVPKASDYTSGSKPYSSVRKASDYSSGSKPYSSGSKASDYSSGSKPYSSGSKASDYSSSSKAYSSGSKASDYSSGSKVYSSVPKASDYSSGSKPYSSVPKASDYSSGSKPYSSVPKASDYSSGSKPYSSVPKASDYSSGSKPYSSVPKASDYSSGSKGYGTGSKAKEYSSGSKASDYSSGSKTSGYDSGSYDSGRSYGYGRSSGFMGHGFNKRRSSFVLLDGKEPLNKLDKLFERVRDVQDQVKTFSEQVDALSAALSIQEKKLQEFVLVVLVELKETDLRQDGNLDKLKYHLAELKKESVALYNHVHKLFELNDGNTLLQLKAEGLWATERAVDVKQDREINTLYTAIKHLKTKLFQVKKNKFDIIFDIIERDTTLLGSIRKRETRRMCEVGQVTLDHVDTRVEYQYQTWFDNVPQIIYGITGRNYKMNVKENPAHYSYGFPIKEPQSIGARVNAYSTKTGIIVEFIDLSFGKTKLLSIDVAFQVCTIGPGTDPVQH